MSMACRAMLHREKMPTYLLQWEAMKRAKRMDARPTICGARQKSSMKATRCGACIASKKVWAVKWCAHSARMILRRINFGIRCIRRSCRVCWM